MFRTKSCRDIGNFHSYNRLRHTGTVQDIIRTLEARVVRWKTDDSHDEQVPTPARKPSEIERQVLPNGVRVVTERMPHVRSVSVGLWIGTGSREEQPHETGLSHFVEHMVFKGTKHRTAEQIARSVDSIGGGLDAFTSKELVSYNVKVLDEHVPEAFDVVADLVRNPLFEPKDIEKEKSVILEELKMEVDNPEYQIHELFSSRFWKGHALGRSILGTKQTIRSFDRDMIEKYYRHFYSPKNILVTAAGNLSHKEMVGLVGDHLGDLKPRPFRPRQSKPHPHAPLVFLQQGIAGAGSPVYRRSLHPDAARTALRLLHPECDSGRRHELAPVPEYPRKTGPGVRDFLRAVHVSRCRLHAGLRRHVAFVPPGR